MHFVHAYCDSRTCRPCGKHRCRMLLFNKLCLLQNYADTGKVTHQRNFNVRYLGALQDCPCICIYFPRMVETHTIVHGRADITFANKVPCTAALVNAHRVRM